MFIYISTEGSGQGKELILTSNFVQDGYVGCGGVGAHLVGVGAHLPARAGARRPSSQRGTQRPQTGTGCSIKMVLFIHGELTSIEYTKIKKK